ncbi:MAG TPA: mechanosensitive ion channel protein MscS [Marinilabiliales bacterium]|nr:MAG: hypothetical protein A2W95_14205 [Bacteroidetes bacterium GWA2_40_14]OFX56610.1 MAG: hypothetical protein A2W84_07425 [Bacteroidetes bacterium GWC2_40_13]OFX71824.1 MAG: hypothetical protein A2W96_06230 [Bacteroidetes bacterium GWD2_40_43]OFX94622.1 MAG: hypothetical protein A2W97_18035 [Bacteroidetes bacterium GWE2_40_63]OFY22416.1 MAG: hypothetical protein A2W88_07705 [Bacteroidetes bacterium GWF2_40_13]OFZ24388.1 MAG: hypothetical protein A2437_18165 [Bacteroidetes bacterium RIFOXYC
MNNLIAKYYEWLVSYGISESIADFLKVATLVGVILVLCLLANFIAKQIIVSFIAGLVKRSKNQWDDIILERRVFNRLAHFAPAMVLYYMNHAILAEFPKWVHFIQVLIYIYMTVVTVLVLTSFMKALHEIYQQSPLAKGRSIKGYIQLANIFIIFIGAIFIISFLTGSSPAKLLAGLGALAAVLMLIFKDTILGLVASVQLSANNMLKIGDWIEMPSNKADGTVLEITLNTVKVQNADNTIITIPTYSMVAESFINWREMEDLGGRRVKRSLFIDVNTVKFVPREWMERIEKTTGIAFSGNIPASDTDGANTKNELTNLGLFRKYVEGYLRKNPKINPNLNLVVRYLQPTENGIPMEVYAFSKETKLAKFEEVQSGIFEHIISIIPLFELRVYQNPSGYNFEKLTQKV